MMVLVTLDNNELPTPAGMYKAPWHEPVNHREKLMEKLHINRCMNVPWKMAMADTPPKKNRKLPQMIAIHDSFGSGRIFWHGFLGSQRFGLTHVTDGCETQVRTWNPNPYVGDSLAWCLIKKAYETWMNSTSNVKFLPKRQETLLETTPRCFVSGSCRK